MTYNEALSILQDRQEKKIGNNTHLVRRGNKISIRLHKTFVLTLCENGTYVITSGGFRTRTTKDRINKYSPIKVYQKDFEWFVGETKFFDGLEVSATGEVLNAA